MLNLAVSTASQMQAFMALLMPFFLSQPRTSLAVWWKKIQPSVSPATRHSDTPGETHTHTHRMSYTSYQNATRSIQILTYRQFVHVCVYTRIAGDTALCKNIHESVSRQIRKNFAKSKWRVNVVYCSLWFWLYCSRFCFTPALLLKWLWYVFRRWITTSEKPDSPYCQGLPSLSTFLRGRKSHLQT